MCYDLLMCIYVISAQFIRNNAKQSRKINPIHSLARSLMLFSLSLLFALLVVYSLMFYAKTILFVRFCFWGKFDEIIYSHSMFHYNGFLLSSENNNKVVLHVLSWANFNAALFSKENCISFLIYQSKALIT